MDLRKIDDNTWEIPAAGRDEGPGRHLCLGPAPRRHPPRPDARPGPQRRLPARHRADVLCHARRPPGLRISRSAASRPSISTRGSSRRAASATTSTAASASSGPITRTTDIAAKRKELLAEIFQEVPAGVGKGGVTKLSRARPQGDPGQGRGVGRRERLRPEGGPRADRGARPDEGRLTEGVSDRALERGIPQLGTLGAGNHFLEIQKVDEIFDEAAARAFGLDGPGPGPGHDPLRQPRPRPPGGHRLHRDHGERLRRRGPARPRARPRPVQVGRRASATTGPCARRSTTPSPTGR